MTGSKKYHCEANEKTYTGRLTSDESFKVGTFPRLPPSQGASLVRMDRHRDRRRKALVECAAFLEELNLKAGRQHDLPELDHRVADYEIDWINSDLLLDLLEVKGLPREQFPQLRRYIDDHAFGRNIRDVTGFHRLLELYADGYEVGSGRVTLKEAEAEMAKKTE